MSSIPGSSILLARPDGLLTSGRAIQTTDLPPELLAPPPGDATWLATTIEGIPVLAISLQGVSADTVFIQLFPLVELERIQRFLILVLIAGAAASGLLGVGIGWWTSKRALRPLTELTASAARVAAGDLQVRLPDQVIRISHRWRRRSTRPWKRWSGGCAWTPVLPGTSATNFAHR